MAIIRIPPGHDNDVIDTQKCSYYSVNQMDKYFPKTTLNIMSINIRSIASSFDDLRDLLASSQTPFSVIAIQEVWSVGKVYSLPGFHPLQATTRDKDGPSNANCGGGVGLFISSMFDFEPMPQLNVFIRGMYESIWFLIKCKSDKNGPGILIASIYRPNTPPFGNLNRAIETHKGILNTISNDKTLSKCKMFIASDFNLDLNLSLTSDSVSEYVAAQASMGLSSLISITAHPTPTTQKVIDHIFSNIPTSQAITGVLREHLSDHLPLIISDQTTETGKSMPKQPKRNMSKANVKSYLTLLGSIDFVVDPTSAKDSFDSFFCLLTEAAELAFPLQKLKSKTKLKSSPWISSGLLVSANSKKILFRKKLKHPTPINLKAFSVFNKIFNKCKRAAKRIYYLNCFNSASNNTKDTWSLISEVTGRSKASASLPSSFSIPSPNNAPPSTTLTMSSDPHAIANGFNNFFGTIGPELASHINQSKFPSNDYASFLGPSPEETFKLFPVSIIQLLDIVKGLKNKSSAGADLISNILLKKAIPLLATPLKGLIDLSFKTGYVPHQMTLAKVVPLHKEGDKSSFNNYRPISILSTIGKVIEKVVHQQLYSYLNSQDILTPSQFGFRTNHGVEHPLLLFSERVRQSLDKGKHNVSIFIDLRKAFDTVNFTLLLAKLKHYGVTGVALLWFQNYLIRSQYVLAGEVISDIFNLLCGIPQGTVLGPLLFLIFVNDFAFATSLMSLLFADDCTLQGEGDDLPSLISYVNGQLHIAEKWFVANLLTLNTKKTKCMFFFSSPTPPSAQAIPPITIGNDVIERVGSGLKETSVRFLGILIDDELLFKEHLASLKKKLSKGLFALASSKLLTPLGVRKTIYFSLFESYLRFGALLFGCAPERDLREITLLQKKAIRHVANASYLAHTEPLFQSLGILKLEDLISLERSILVHKFKHNKLPEAFSHNFLLPIDEASMSRRQDPQCYLPPTNNNPLTPRSPVAKLISTWNAVPLATKSIGCHKAFKAELKSSFILSYSSVCSKQKCRACGHH